MKLVPISAWGKTARIRALAILALFACLWLCYAATEGRARLKAKSPELSARAEHMQRQIAEYARLQGIPPPRASAADLSALLRNDMEAAGLSRMLERIEAVDRDQVSATFRGVPFAAWLKWVSGVQGHALRVVSCRIEATGQPGLVNVTVVLGRPATR